ncbi:MAG: chorismate-binding protein [Cellulomonadaceae bacterium]|nr:chorismate-binding protein [Cellulomonadaceae bacterium]
MSIPLLHVVTSAQLPSPVPDSPDPATLIGALPLNEPPVAWVRRGDGLIGWGEAARWEGSGPGRFAEASAWWREVTRAAAVDDAVGVCGSGLVAFGSFAFDDASAENSVLIVPRVVLGRRADGAWMTTVFGDGRGSSGDDRGCVGGPGAEHGAGGGDESGEDRCVVGDTADARARYCSMVDNAVGRISAGELEKVVLARAESASVEAGLTVKEILMRLATRFDTTWAFHVAGLVGATPEMLVRTERGLALSRVLAGTIRREESDTDDDALLRSAQLARSSKDLLEHQHAVESVAQALEPFCASMNVPEQPFVLHLPNVMHLASDVTGVLNADEARTSLELAAALHPSAAVCGTPRAAAQAVITELEGFDRGRYSGPVGWMGADGDGEWGIALRCARLDDAGLDEAGRLSQAHSADGRNPQANAPAGWLSQAHSADGVRLDDAGRLSQARSADGRNPQPPAAASANKSPQRARLYAGCGVVGASTPESEYAESEAKLQPMRWALSAG